MITFDIIHAQYEMQLAVLTERYPLTRWAVQPAGVDLSRSKARYGEATVDGKVLISPYYTGTASFTHLNHTLCHEFAHLAVGLNHGHDRHFRHVERLFKMHLPPVSVAEADAVKANVPYKYQVIAHLQNGERVDLGGVHRKTKRYSHYDPTKTVFKCGGEPVTRFEFLPYLSQ